VLGVVPLLDGHTLLATGSLDATDNPVTSIGADGPTLSTV
jgi:hypothetical protein